jgi:hypothetical protein
MECRVGMEETFKTCVCVGRSLKERSEEMDGLLQYCFSAGFGSVGMVRAGVKRGRRSRRVECMVYGFVTRIC